MYGHRLVLIEWEDSAQPMPCWRWLSQCDEFDFVICQSVGWLVHDGKHVKALAPNIGSCMNDEDKQVSGLIRIPARCIRKIATLSETPLTSASESPVPSSRPG